MSTLQADEYVRDASGGFVVITTASWYLPAAAHAGAGARDAVTAEVLPAAQSVQASKTSVYTWACPAVVLSTQPG